MPPRMIAPESVGAGGGGARVPIPMPDTSSGLQRGVLFFTEKTQDILDREIALERMSTLAQAQSDFSTALDRKRLELASDPDIAGRETKMQQFAQEKFSELRGGMDHGTAAYFDRAGKPLADSINLSVRHQARADTIEKAVTSLAETNNGLVIKAGDAKSPVERDAVIAQIDENLKHARDTEMLSAPQYEKMRKDTLVKVDQAEALRRIRENPAGMQQQLANSAFLPNLDPVARQNLIDKAGNEVNRRASLAYTQEARRDLQERRTLAKMGDDAMKEIIDMADPGGPTGGTLTSNDVEARRPYLKADDYKAAKALLRGGAATDDINTLSVLAPELGNRDLKNELTNALLAKRITRETYNSYLAKNEQLLKDDTPASPYKRGREQIIEGLKPGALLSGPAADIQKQALVNALREFDDMSLRLGPKGLRDDPATALDAAAEIRNRYRIVNFDRIGEAVGLPRFVKGNRETVTLDDLNLAGRQIVEELDKGNLSKAEADDQLRKIELWEQILNDRNAALEAQKNKPPKPKAQGGGQ